MTVSDQERSTFVEEWTTACFTLPADMQPAELPQDGTLKVPELPTHAWVAANNGGAQQALSAGIRLENPVVNPVYGGAPGQRTQGDVRKETIAYREATRGAGATGLTPIFQGDFVLIQLHGASLALHTVCNGALLEQATEEDMSFTTAEYAHSAQHGAAGLWGTFAKKTNPAYDPLDKKSGTKFTRHSGIRRSHVVIYNVQVFKDSDKALRISLGSLQELARARPNDFSLPDPIPATHSAAGGRGGRRQQQQPADDDDGDQQQQQQQPAADDDGDQQQQQQQPAADDDGDQQQQQQQPEEGDNPVSDDEASDDEAEAAASGAMARADRTGTEMEIQGCDPDCDYVCAVCEWESCLIVADHGRSCDVCMSSDEERFDGVLNRYLRMPAAAVGKRSRRGNP